MTPREQAAFRSSIRAAVDLALVAAVTIEIRDDACEVRQQAAVAALQGLGEGLKVAFLDTPAGTDPTPSTCISPAFTGADDGTMAIDSTYDETVIG